jgi:hypothetical protein
MTTATKEIGFTKKFDAAITLIERVTGIKIIKTAGEFESAKQDYKTLIDYEKQLDDEYASLPCVIDAKIAQAARKDLATKLEAAKKGLKNGSMLKYEQEQERIRVAEQNRLAEIARKEQEAETARLVAEQKKAFDAAEKLRKAAEKKGDEEAAERAREAAAAAAQTAKEIKADAAMAPVPVVVVEKTAPSVTRRTVAKFEIVDASKIPRQYLKPDEVAIGGVVRSLKMSAQIPGVRVWEETV